MTRNLEHLSGLAGLHLFNDAADESGPAGEVVTPSGHQHADPDGTEGTGDTQPRVASTEDECRMLKDLGLHERFNSQIRRSPSSVSHGSTRWIVSACGAIRSARPPVAITGASTPSSLQMCPTIPSTWPAKP